MAHRPGVRATTSPTHKNRSLIELAAVGHPNGGSSQTGKVRRQIKSVGQLIRKLHKWSRLAN